MSTTKIPKNQDPLFLALEARLTKQDAATRADRVQALIASLESQITGAVVVPGNGATQSPVDTGNDAVGCYGIFWNGTKFYCEYSGECVGFSGGKYLDDDGDKYDHFMSVRHLVPESMR